MGFKSNFAVFVLHVFIITYLIIIMIDAPDNVLMVFHFLSPFVLITTLYYTIKSYTSVAGKSHLKNEKTCSNPATNFSDEIE